MMYEAQISYVSEEKAVKEWLVVENEELFKDVEDMLYDTFNGLSELDVMAIRRSKIKEVANNRQSQDDLMWLAEVRDVFLTDEGNEKEMKYKILFYAKTFDAAKAFMAEYLTQGYNMELIGLKLSKFSDVL